MNTMNATDTMHGKENPDASILTLSPASRVTLHMHVKKPSALQSSNCALLFPLFSLRFSTKNNARNQIMRVCLGGRDTDQKPGLSWLCQVAGPRAACVARGEVGDAVDAADGLQVVGGTVAVLVTLGCQVCLEDFVARTVTHPNEQRPCKQHSHFLLGIFFCGL